jgi:ABC-type Fe3+ transport system permease subunit
VWRVTLPLLGPSILASATIVFAFALDDFVIVNQLSRDASTKTVSMAIYGAAPDRAATPGERDRHAHARRINARDRGRRGSCTA